MTRRAASVKGGRRAFAVAAVGIALGACGANHNEDERHRYAEASDLFRPDPTVCNATCLETPPPERVNCEAAVEGYEFLPAIDISGVVTVYQYDDKTPASLWGVPFSAYQPASVPLERCIGESEDEPNRVMHIRGGPYLYYGGGVGRALSEISPSVDLPESTEYGVWARDVSRWEGVSFWARRGVESQPGVRVAIGDKYVDEDLAYVDYYTRAVDLPESPIHPRPEEAYCRRARECDCPLGKPCSYYEGTSTGANAGWYCWDPEVDLPPESPADLGDPHAYPPGTRLRQPSQGSPVINHDRCQSTQCNRFYSAYEGKTEFTPPSDYCPPSTSCDDERPSDVNVGGFDPEFYGRECATHTFSTGFTGDYCFDPGEDPPPPENDEWCTDNRYVPVLLSTEWEFHTVPFSEMLQYGYAKESFDFDLQNAGTVRFTWDRGWAEFWIDDVAFYRRADR